MGSQFPFQRNRDEWVSKMFRRVPKSQSTLSKWDEIPSRQTVAT